MKKNATCTTALYSYNAYMKQLCHVCSIDVTMVGWLS